MKQRHIKSSAQNAKAVFQCIGVSIDTKFSDLKEKHLIALRSCMHYDNFHNFKDSNKSIEQNYFEMMQKRARN